jgi:mRNA-degrading endonuclease RelE of RelBE toxin-antitoxin system
VKIARSAAEAIASLHLDKRKAVRAALDALDKDSGVALDVVPLERELAGYSRLRVGDLRLVFSRDSKGTIHIEHLAQRRTVYDEFRSAKGLG